MKLSKQLHDKSVGEGMEKIHSLDYAGLYAMESRKVFLIGANFTERKEARRLKYKIEEL